MTCDDFPKESFGITSGAVSGYINDRPTFCGGLSPNYPVYCYQYYYESKTFNKFDGVELHTGAFDGAYAQWRNSGIIVAGGRNGAGEDGVLNIIQIVTESGTETWNITDKIIDSCLVNLHDDTFLLISGFSFPRSLIVTVQNGKLEPPTEYPAN